MVRATLARMAPAVVALILASMPTASPAESVFLDIDQPQWERGIMLPAYCDIPIDLGGAALSVQGVTVQVQGVPREGSMTLCKGGGCDTFPCHQTLLVYFMDDRAIKAWVPLEGPDDGYDFEIPLRFADCYPDCYHPCVGRDITPAEWGFLLDDGRATLRLERQGDLDGCGTTCLAENGIERVTVKVDFMPRDGTELAAWGTIKAVYR